MIRADSTSCRSASSSCSVTPLSSSAKREAALFTTSPAVGNSAYWFSVLNVVGDRKRS